MSHTLEAKRQSLSRTAAPSADTLCYVDVYHASPLERIAIVKEGVAAVEAKRIFQDVGVGQGAGLNMLNLSAATVNKKAQARATLSREESERVVGFARLVGQVKAMVEESGSPENFDAGMWLTRWLAEPLPAFGGVKPADLMDTMEGQGMVSSALAQLQSGAYA